MVLVPRTVGFSYGIPRRFEHTGRRRWEVFETGRVMACVFGPQQRLPRGVCFVADKIIILWDTFYQEGGWRSIIVVFEHRFAWVSRHPVAVVTPSDATT